MSTVMFKRGDDITMDNTPIQDGLLFFNEEDTMRTIRDKKMTDSFEDALARKEFKLWFQPKYNPITKKLVGAEALVRWYTPDGAIIQPGDFILSNSMSFGRPYILKTSTS